MMAYRLLALFALALTPGCFVFDASLYMDRDAGADASTPLQGELAEICGDEAPLLTLGQGVRSYTFAVDTRGAQDMTRDVVGCTGRLQNGPDLFLAIETTPEDRWHFHVRVDPSQGGANPSIYVLQACDLRACDDGDGTDVCGPGSDEHFTFVPAAGSDDPRYVVAFDSPDPDGFVGNVEAYRTICGDGTLEHSENCDDGNESDDDDCDSQCRTVLRGSSPLEAEVNDDIYSANALRLAAGSTMNVRGEINRLCEVDVFAVEVPEGGSLSATFAAEGGGECPAVAEETTLELLELTANGQPRVRVRGSAPDGSVCPAIGTDVALARDLPAGTYYLRVAKVQERPDVLRYQLEVTLE